MIYVASDLCNGCGICIEACTSGAISMQDQCAVIDQTLCTSCGLCADVCPSGAVVTSKTGSSLSPRGAPANPPEAEPQRAGAPILLSSAPATVVATSFTPSAPVRTSRLDTVEKVLSGLLGFVGFALDVKRSIAGTSAASGPNAASRATGPGQGRSRGGQGRGCGGRHGRDDTCGSRGRNRTT